MPLEFAIEDPAGNKYAFNFPQLEVSESSHPDGGGDDDGSEVEGEGAIYVATALSCKRLADSWGSYLGTLR